jgi:hypothetical protein
MTFVVQGRRLLRSDLSVTPRHELVETVDLVVGDAAESIGEAVLERKRTTRPRMTRIDRFFWG